MDEETRRVGQRGRIQTTVIFSYWKRTTTFDDHHEAKRRHPPRRQSPLRYIVAYPVCDYPIQGDDSDEDSDYDSDVVKKRVVVKKKVVIKENRFVKRSVVKKKVNYADPKSDEDVSGLKYLCDKITIQINSDDVLEWEEDEPILAETSTSSAETIEKILKSRLGFPGATGSSTTCYNVAEKGDPNQRREGQPSEQQFLIK